MPSCSAEHLQGRTSPQRRKTKLLLIPRCQLVCHPCYTLPITIQLLHRDLVVWKALGWCWCKGRTSREFAVSPNSGARWEPEAVSTHAHSTQPTVTVGTGICLQARPHPPCRRHQVSPRFCTGCRRWERISGSGSYFANSWNLVSVSGEGSGRYL